MLSRFFKTGQPKQEAPKEAAQSADQPRMPGDPVLRRREVVVGGLASLLYTTLRASPISQLEQGIPELRLPPRPDGLPNETPSERNPTHEPPRHTTPPETATQSPQPTPTPARYPTQVSEAGIKLIKSFEQLQLKAYRCSAGRLTIGYGHRRTVTKGQSLRGEAEADKLLRKDLKKYADEVLSVFKDVYLTQGQFDALVSATFNGWCLERGTSTFAKKALELIPKINSTNDRDEKTRLTKEIVTALCEFRYANNQFQNGLLRRRLSEGLLFAGAPDPVIPHQRYKALVAEISSALKMRKPPSKLLVPKMITAVFTSEAFEGKH